MSAIGMDQEITKRLVQERAAWIEAFVQDIEKRYPGVRPNDLMLVIEKGSQSIEGTFRVVYQPEKNPVAAIEINRLKAIMCNVVQSAMEYGVKARYSSVPLSGPRYELHVEDRDWRALVEAAASMPGCPRAVEMANGEYNTGVVRG